MKLEEANNHQNEFKSKLNKKKNVRFKSWEWKSAMQDMKMLYNARNKVVKLFDDYFTIVSEFKYKTIHGEGSKTLTPKQILWRLQIARA